MRFGKCSECKDYVRLVNKGMCKDCFIRNIKFDDMAEVSLRLKDKYEKADINKLTDEIENGDLEPSDVFGIQITFNQ